MIYQDVTVPISEAIPVWPGDPPPQMEWVARMARGDELNLSRLHLGSHTGTHVDAPFHFIEQGLTVDRLSPDLFVGPAWIASLEAMEGRTIGPADLEAAGCPAGTTRLLLKTRNSAYWRQQAGFRTDFCHVGPAAARWLIERGVRVVGIDYLSIEAFGTAQPEVHRALLGAGLVIIEGLDLSQVAAGACQLVCLPLKIEGAEGAPARVLIGRE